MSDKFQQIVAINLKDIPDFALRAAHLSRKPVLQIYDTRSPLLINICHEIDAILVSIYEPLDEHFLKQFPKLKYIGVLGSSTKKIALDYCEVHNISVSKVLDYCDHETAEWVLLQILKFYRDRDIPHSVYQKTLGLVGIGAVGFKLAQKALGLGLNLNFYAPHSRLELGSLKARALSKEDIFRNSSIISFHTPAHVSWLSYELLALLPKEALLINTCLGKISEGDDFERFLGERSDVNLIMDSIAAASYPELRSRSIVDMHSAYETTDSKTRLIDKFFKNAQSF